MEKTRTFRLSASALDGSDGNNVPATPDPARRSLSTLPEISVNHHAQNHARPLYTVPYLVRQAIRRCGRAEGDSLAGMGASRVRRFAQGICECWCSAMGTVLRKPCTMPEGVGCLFKTSWPNRLFARCLLSLGWTQKPILCSQSFTGNHF